MVKLVDINEKFEVFLSESISQGSSAIQVSNMRGVARSVDNKEGK